MIGYTSAGAGCTAFPFASVVRPDHPASPSRRALTRSIRLIAQAKLEQDARQDELSAEEDYHSDNDVEPRQHDAAREQRKSKRFLGYLIESDCPRRSGEDAASAS